MYLSREKFSKGLLLAGIVVLCVLIVGVILSGVKQFKAGSQLSSINQVSNLSHLLVRQQANLFSMMLVKNTKSEELNNALDAFANEEFVLDANLYSPSGQLLAQSSNALNLKNMLVGDDETQRTQLTQQPTQQIVEPIFAKQDLVGFLRVTFDAQYGQTTKSKIDQIFHQLYGELIILVLTGALLASSLHYLFQKRKLIIHTSNRAMPEKAKSQTQRFHSRRRMYQRK